MVPLLARGLEGPTPNRLYYPVVGEDLSPIAPCQMGAKEANETTLIGVVFSFIGT